MASGTAITEVENVPETGSFLFTTEDRFTNETVYLTDDNYTFGHEGASDEAPPGSSSHLSF